MKFTHMVMQRAFSARHTLSLRKNRTSTHHRKKLKQLIKPFVVHSLKNGVTTDRHVLSDEEQEPQTPDFHANGHSNGTNEKPAEDFVGQYDEIIVVTAEGLKNGVFDQMGTSDRTEGIRNLLQEALGPRVQELGCQTVKQEGKEKLLIGLILDQKFAYENVIKGPAANDAAAAADFRKLWGKWSECRRFADLTTCEAVFFPAKTLAEKRNIPLTIVEHILREHFRISAAEIGSSCHQVNQMLKPAHVLVEAYGSGEEVLNRISLLLEDLIKKIRGVKNLPLAVTSLQGISAVFRGSDVWPFAHIDNTSPDHRMDACFLPVFEVVMHLEASGKWPDDLNALRAVKFQLIRETCVRFQKELQLSCLASPSHFDVYYEGYVFRIIPSVGKEVTLLRQVHSRMGVMTTKLDDSVEADAIFTQNQILTKLTGGLNGLNTRFVAYNTTCRLAKRWISSQYMSGYLDDTVVELLVAHTFLSASVPTTPMSGFVRFLHLLSSFPFGTQPLIVDPIQTFTEKDVSKVQKFYKNLTTKPPLFVVTPYDRKFGMFCKVRGSVNAPGVTKLLIECAKKCHRQLIDMLISPKAGRISSLFTHEVEKPHVLIHMKKKKNMAFCSKDEATTTDPLPHYSPVVEYLKVLRRVFDEFAVFLCDLYAPSIIIIVYWKSMSFHTKQVTNCDMSEKLLLEPFFSSGGDALTLNIEAVIESFSVLGQGIVHRIESKVENWPVL